MIVHPKIIRYLLFINILEDNITKICDPTTRLYWSSYATYTSCNCLRSCASLRYDVSTVNSKYSLNVMQNKMRNNNETMDADK